MIHDRFRRLRFCLYLLAVSVLFFLQPQLWAQVDRGTITGTVTDNTGAVVPGVQVMAIQVETNTKYTSVSNGLGIYSVLNLPIGTYSVSFDKQGFKTVVQNGIVILANHTSAVDVRLEIGSISQTVQVTATPILDMQTETGSNYTQEEINDMPVAISALGVRDQLEFSFQITPNVGGDPWYSTVNGSQQYTKNVLLDGTSIDSGVVGDLTETGPSPDAIEQVQVDTNGIRAEDGRSGGGVFMLEMKSGTNQWHGSAFYYTANEDLNANTWDNNWYLSQCGSALICPNGNSRNIYGRARDRFNDWGVSGGGPIRKNHTFFYSAFEKYAQSDWRTSPNQATAPTAKMLTGDFSELLTYAAATQRTTKCPTNPCPTGYNDPAGNPIYYGAIFLPDGTVASGNVIPAGMMSAAGQKVAAIYQQYYKPTGGG